MTCVTQGHDKRDYCRGSQDAVEDCGQSPATGGGTYRSRYTGLAPSRTDQRHDELEQCPGDTDIHRRAISPLAAQAMAMVLANGTVQHAGRNTPATFLPRSLSPRANGRQNCRSLPRSLWGAFRADPADSSTVLWDAQGEPARSGPRSSRPGPAMQCGVRRYGFIRPAADLYGEYKQYRTVDLDQQLPSTASTSTRNIIYPALVPVCSWLAT